MDNEVSASLPNLLDDLPQEYLGQVSNPFASMFVPSEASLSFHEIPAVFAIELCMPNSCSSPFVAVHQAWP